jgi:hypothetical protein
LERDSTLTLVVLAIRIVATDLIVFAGVDLDDAVTAVREGILEHEVCEPATVAPKRFRWAPAPAEVTVSGGRARLHGRGRG